MSDISFRSAVELMAALESKEVSSRELLDHYLDRIEEFNPKINAVVALDVERARTAAAAVDDARASGKPVAPLAGLPMTIKDSIETEGLVTTSGAPELKDHVPERDADAVERLKAAGAVVFGKTNPPMYASDLQSFNDVYGTTNNPWDVTRIPGGSSGGAAAALAAGLTGLELGSDIAGSIRNPAHFCGVYGHKPSYGIVSGRGHIPGPPGSLTVSDVGVLGPMGRSADDLDLGLGVLAAPPPDRAVAWKIELPPPRQRRLTDFRVAAWLDEPSSPVDDQVLSVIAASIDALRAKGVAVDEKARPQVSFDELTDIFLRTVWSVFAPGTPQPMLDAADQYVADNPEPAADAGPDLMLRIMAMRHRHWLVLNERRERARVAWAQFFRDYDIVLAPAISVPAFPHDHSEQTSRTLTVNGEERPYMESLNWSGVFGCVYLPGTVAPVGLTKAGLPVGVQVVGPFLEDRTCIEFARLLGDVVGGYQQPPGF